MYLYIKVKFIGQGFQK